MKNSTKLDMLPPFQNTYFVDWIDRQSSSHRRHANEQSSLSFVKIVRKRPIDHRRIINRSLVKWLLFFQYIFSKNGRHGKRAKDKEAVNDRFDPTITKIDRNRSSESFIRRKFDLIPQVGIHTQVLILLISFPIYTYVVIKF